MSRRAAAAAAALGAFALVVCGCGVSAQDAPRVIALDVSAAPTSPAPTSSTGLGGEATSIYLVRGGSELIRRDRVLTPDPTPEELLAALVNGPQGTEGQSGLSTAVQGATVVPGPAGTPPGVITVEVPEGSRTDENLAFGQVVLTLTRSPAIDGVQFTREGKVQQVPKDDGTLDAGPLTRADYQGLLSDAG